MGMRYRNELQFQLHSLFFGYPWVHSQSGILLECGYYENAIILY